jgi:hypothetical protein
MVTVGLPLNVKFTFVPGWIAPLPALIATWTGPTLSDPVPYSLVNCTRTALPPALTRTIFL